MLDHGFTYSELVLQSSTLWHPSVNLKNVIWLSTLTDKIQGVRVSRGDKCIGSLGSIVTF